MIKRVLHFGNPAFLSLKNKQLEIRLLEEGKDWAEEGLRKQPLTASAPIEDLGVIVLESPRIILTSALMSALVENNCAVVTCDEKHLPTGLTLSLDGNSLQSERYQDQISASLPLKKQLWQQTVSAKIHNQAKVLQNKGVECGNMLKWADTVKSGDVDNLEARAAVYYWSHFFTHIPDFVRGREEAEPNSLLNYGYAILRAMVARALVGAGLLTTLGIFHHNRYNAYCLADDIMEPYRPYVDIMVDEMTESGKIIPELNKSIKTQFLSLPVKEVSLGGNRSPMMIAIQSTANSLYKCFSGESRKILYPVIS